MQNLNILYLAPTLKSDDAFWPGLRSIADHVYATSDLIKARNLLSEHDFQVGLVQFEPYEDRFLHHSIDDIIHHQQGVSMAWVALVSSASIEDEGICSLIADHFHDYDTLPCNLDRLRNTLRHAVRMADIRKKAHPNGNGPILKGDLVGTSPVMIEVSRSIEKVVRYELPVLITGESGTGKEIAAMAIHKHSPRTQGPFVAVNCGALPPNLIQSELFGHEKGAFTGAHQRKIGLLEQASGGTLFLDEIGELPLDLQANLLRVLQQRIFFRVGGHEEIALNARVISATHVDLEVAVQQGSFRQDLYYRLNVLRVTLPPLRDRGEDIEVLAQHFLEAFQKEHSCKARQFARRALKAMRHYHWPGNVRELKNRVERALVMSEHRAVTSADLGLESCATRPSPPSLREAKERAEREAVVQALEHNGNSVPAAARSLNVSHVTLYRLIKKYGIALERRAESR